MNHKYKKGCKSPIFHDIRLFQSWVWSNACVRTDGCQLTMRAHCEECMLSLLMQFQFYRQYITCIVQIHRAMMLQADRRYIMGLCIVTCTTLWLLNALYFLFLLFYLCVCLVWMEAYALMTLSCSWPLIWLAGSWPDPSTTRCLALGQPLWPGLEWVCVNFRHLHHVINEL